MKPNPIPIRNLGRGLAQTTTFQTAKDHNFR
jgi:hypothetical protein